MAAPIEDEEVAAEPKKCKRFKLVANTNYRIALQIDGHLYCRDCSYQIFSEDTASKPITLAYAMAHLIHEGYSLICANPNCCEVLLTSEGMVPD